MMTSPAPRVSEVHPELFHYTSEEGLFGILQSQHLRATHWRYLNDQGELIHLRDELPRLFMPELLQRANEVALANEAFKVWLSHVGGVDAFCRTQARGLVDAMYAALVCRDPDEQLFEFYVTSFCAPEEDYVEVRNHGLLSQWRYYGQQGGYALVFNTAQLELLMEREQAQWPCRLALGDVAYSSDPPEVLAKRLETLPELKSAIVRWTSQPDSEDAAGALLQPLMDCCTRYKHWAFAEEREVRLVAVLNSPRMVAEHEAAGTPVVERVRDTFGRDGVLVPCLHLFEGIEVDRKCRLPIRRIIVGPGPNQGDRESRLRGFLRDSGYSIPITCSCIPIRF